ncbi:MAG TPA: hypothetical protein VK821_11440 [Dehalococcoidia bacterium]|nr:hypothetical protein [Dehalococcoidia bacterium]
MKRTLLALSLAAALVIPLTSGRPSIAHAGDLSHSCGMTDVDVTVNRVGDQVNPHYDYYWGCSDDAVPYHDEHYIGDWDSSRQEAHVVDTIQHALLLGDSTWACVSNPWDVDLGPYPSCRLTAGVTASGQINFPLGPIVRSERHVLHAQLQNAIDQAALLAAQEAATRAAFLATEVTPTTTTNNSAIYSALGTTLTSAPAPTQPDLKVPTVGGDMQLAQGHTSVYSIGVSNVGTRPQTQVQVSIQVNGSLQYAGMDKTPAGWDCSGSAPILCTGPLGGYGDPVQNLAVNFQLRVLAATAGGGTITVKVDPNGLIQESNENNNSNYIIVTVK